MKVITERELIKTVPQRWKSRYSSGKYGQDKIVIMEQLDNLNIDTVSSEEISKIIGNNSWTLLKCNECNKSVKTVIQLGDEPDYESHTVFICLECIKNLNKLIKTIIL
jgi:hypothetical protein